MNKKLLLLLYLLFTSVSFSQQAKIDSLINAFQKQSDKEKIETSLLIFETNISRDSAIIYLNKGMEVAKKIKFDSIFPLQFGLSASYFYKGEFSNAKSEIKKALTTYTFTKAPNAKKGQIFMLLGVYSEAENKIDSAQSYYDKAIDILNNDSSNTAINVLTSTYNNQANIYLKAGNYEKAVEIYLKAARLSEKNSDLENTLIAYNNIAGCYKEMKRLDKALMYYKEANKLTEKIGDIQYKGSTLVGIGEIYFLKNENTQAKESLKDAIKCLETYEFSQPLNAANQILASIYLSENNYFLAKQFSKEALNGATQMDDAFLMASIFITQSELFQKTKKYNESNQAITQAIDIAQKHNFQYLKKEGYLQKIKVLKEIGNYKMAVDLIDTVINLNEDILNTTKLKIIENAETKYQTEKKEKENLALKKKNAEQQLAVQQAINLNQRYGFIAVTAVLFGCGIFYYSKNRRRKLRDEHIINLAQTKQKEHEKIGADLHSTKAKDLEKIASALEEKGEAAIASKVRDVKDSIRLLSHELFQIPFSQLEFDDQIINLLFEYNSESLKITHQGIHTIPWPQVNNTIRRNLYLIISEAISNIKNHSGASEANLKFQKNNQNIDVTITDNGKGFSDEDLKNGHGIGNMRMRINEIKGSIRFDAVKDKGSEIGIFITAF